ncbi:hypothetical protein SAY87_020938 [Trapa incisa]|uniref:Leucine-rich repeat-containing N-terminal plant-type domain-containing protein n=1 Tax=Trapa incisa TaxID=236973 RepID=A0AAN7JRK7_9MYRT|nr:hypothetical protein SAY87_020938 [Trapa incisa]
MEHYNHFLSCNVILLLLLLTLPAVVHGQGAVQQPPSPSPARPVPLNFTFTDLRLAVVYPVIQAFKLTITSDPLGITASWAGPDICSYTGFYCDAPPDNLSATAIAAVDFNGYRLSAPTLGSFIDLLPDLALFHANSNNFSGTIPPGIARLPYLYELDISNNNLSGQFPSAVFEIAGLSFLDIRFNSFTGSVPPQVFSQYSLDALFINNNNFIMSLPSNLGSTPVLYLTLANNKFTGPIPRTIGNASSTLTEVLLLNNLLTGCLPYEIGLLKKATVFDVGNNLLTGQLPYSLACLESIEQLNFAGNYLYGEVPEALCGVESLVNLSLSGNFFTRIGPTCWKLVKSGVLDLRKNCIYGIPDQRPYWECSRLLAHPKVCPNYWWHWHNYVPCKISHSPPLPPQNPAGKSRPGRPPPQQARPASVSVTYRALTNHHRL